MASLPVIPIDPAALHKQRAVDFADEDNVKKYMRSNRFLSLDLPGTGIRLVRTNWLVFVPASIFLWAFVIAVLTSAYYDAKGANQNSALDEFGMWMTWVAQNLAWLYIATQVPGPLQPALFFRSVSMSDRQIHVSDWRRVNERLSTKKSEVRP